MISFNLFSAPYFTGTVSCCLNCSDGKGTSTIDANDVQAATYSALTTKAENEKPFFRWNPEGITDIQYEAILILQKNFRAARLRQEAGLEIDKLWKYDKQFYLGPFRDRYMVACNLPQNDLYWDSNDPEWVGRASMSKRHRFLITRDLHWRWFNCLVFGMIQADGNLVEPYHRSPDALQEVEAMKEAALHYVSMAREEEGWSSNVGLYFHCFGYNSVNSLHLHIVDLDSVGPSFDYAKYKNCPIDAVIEVLREEPFVRPCHKEDSAPLVQIAPRTGSKKSSKSEATIRTKRSHSHFSIFNRDDMTQKKPGAETFKGDSKDSKGSRSNGSKKSSSFAWASERTTESRDDALRTNPSWISETSGEPGTKRKRRTSFFSASPGDDTMAKKKSIVKMWSSERDQFRFEFRESNPSVNDAATFRKARAWVWNNEGPGVIGRLLKNDGFLAPSKLILTTGTSPFNVFARLANQDTLRRSVGKVFLNMQRAAFSQQLGALARARTSINSLSTLT